MSETPQAAISDAEYEVMRILWAQGETTSRFASQVLKDKMQWKSGTVKTLLHRLMEKGFLTQTKVKNHYCYRATISEETARHDRLVHIIDDTCNTKVDQIIIDAINAVTLDPQMLQHIQDALNKKTPSPTVQCQCEPGQCECHPELH